VEWWNAPAGIAISCYEAIPMLRAQESLYGSTVVAVGGGNMKKADISKTLRDWNRQAQPKRMEPKKRLTPSEMKERLKAYGIGYEERHGRSV
jgi:hypothetical protein